MTSKQPCRYSTPDSAHGSATPSSSSRTGNRQLCQTDELAAGEREGIPQMPRPRRRDLQRTIPHPAQAGRAPSPGRSPPGLVHRFARQIRETSGQRAGHASNRQTCHKSGHHAERRERSGRTRAVPPIGDLGSRFGQGECRQIWMLWGCLYAHRNERGTLCCHTALSADWV